MHFSLMGALPEIQKHSLSLDFSLRCVILGCVKKSDAFTNPEVTGLMSYTNMCCFTLI